MPAKSVFSSVEICAILDSCHKNNVKLFKIDSLEIAFETSPEQASFDEGFVNQPNALADALAKAEEFVDEPQDPTPEGKELLEELRLAQLMTDDPSAYEQEMIDANLTEQAVTDETEDYRGS